MEKKILIYAHNGLGLGHIIRSSAIAAEIKQRRPNYNIIVATGSRFDLKQLLPPGVEWIKLPSFEVTIQNNKYSRKGAYLNLPIESIVGIRASLLKALFLSFSPDLVLVDHEPRGVENELRDIVKIYSEQGGKLVIGLRDIVGLASGNFLSHKDEDIILQHYNKVLVYGDKKITDLQKDYILSELLLEKIEYTGYVVRNFKNNQSTEINVSNHEQLVVCSVGSGQDAAEILSQVANVACNIALRTSTKFVICTGPYLPQEDYDYLYTLAQKFPANILIYRFLPNLFEIMCNADLIISRGGYNTMTEILLAAKPAIIIPRIGPDIEQLLRAQKFQEAGICQLLLPEQIEQHLENMIQNGHKNQTSVDIKTNGAECAALSIIKMCE